MAKRAEERKNFGMLIHFHHAGGAYLPELAAYAAFLEKRNHRAVVHRDVTTLPLDAQTVWWMCGRAPAKARHAWPRAFHVHEYASASVPPLAALKDMLKRHLQPLPDYRIFQNAWVRAAMDFADAVPFAYRDMGVPATFLQPTLQVTEPRYDFVYLGDLSRLQYFTRLLRALHGSGHRVLLIGEPDAALHAELKRSPLLHCTGRVLQEQIPPLLRQARYALNLVPDQRPYHQQTSTKLLEYCAVGLPVISTNYAWVRQFATDTGARLGYIPSKGSEVAYAKCIERLLRDTQFHSPAMDARAWPAVLEALPIWRQLGVQP